MNITRREILRFVGGSAAGLLLSPFPWKALNDTANWSQNWPGVPEPERGDVSYRLTTCSLCPVACGMRVRCIDQRPVSLSGIANHPFNNGALCSNGIIAHHLRVHPARLKNSLQIKRDKNSFQQKTITLTELMNEVAGTIKDAMGLSQAVAIIDVRPDRTASHLYQQFISYMPNGIYNPIGEPSLDILAAMLEKPSGSLCYDIDNAKTILSFGTPIFDHWGSPMRAARYLDQKSETKQRIIQVETNQSQTAVMADRWIPVRPGTEAVFALGLSHVILKEGMNRANILDMKEFESIVESFTPSVVSMICGISQEAVKETARVFTSYPSSIAIADGLSASNQALTAIMSLNLLIGNIGQTGGVAVRQEVASVISRSNANKSVPTNFNTIPDHSIRLLILDESLSSCSVPDGVLQRKLSENGAIVSLSPFVTQRSFCTQYVVPTPVFPESYSEVLGSPDRTVSTMSISTPLVDAPSGVVNPVQFIQQLAHTMGLFIESGTTEELLKKRTTAIFNQGRGDLFIASTGQTREVKTLSSSDDMWNAFVEGGCWIDSPSKSIPELRNIHFSSALLQIDVNTLKAEGVSPLVLLPYDEHGIYATISLSPLMSKVGQESGLRASGNHAYLHPSTATEFGISDGDIISMRTNKGQHIAQARYDVSVMPGIVMAISAEERVKIISLCDTRNDGSVIPTAVKIEKV